MPKIKTMSLLRSIHTLIIVSRQLNWRPTPFDYIKWTSFLNLDNCLNLKKMVSTKDDEMRFWSAAAASATADASVKWMNYYSKTLRQPPASYLEINKRAFVSYARYITFASPTPFTTLNYIDFYLIRWLSYSFIFDDRRRRSVALCDFYRIVVERSDIKQLLKKFATSTLRESFEMPQRCRRFIHFVPNSACRRRSKIDFPKYSMTKLALSIFIQTFCKAPTGTF